MRAQFAKLLSIWIAVGATAMTPSAIAGPIYEFINTDGLALAEIELQAVPANFGDVLSYRFTASGDAIFHLGLGVQTFSGFSSFWGTSILDDGHGGLMGSATYSPGEVLSTLETTYGGFYTGFYGINSDFIRSSSDPFAVSARGNYVVKAAVPEPASWAMFGIGLLVLAAIRRTSQRRCIRTSEFEPSDFNGADDQRDSSASH